MWWNISTMVQMVITISKTNNCPIGHQVIQIVQNHSINLLVEEIVYLLRLYYWHLFLRNVSEEPFLILTKNASPLFDTSFLKIESISASISPVSVKFTWKQCFEKCKSLCSVFVIFSRIFCRITIFNCSQTKFVAIILVLSAFFMRFFVWPIFRLTLLTCCPQRRDKQVAHSVR